MTSFKSRVFNFMVRNGLRFPEAEEAMLEIAGFIKSRLRQ